MRNEIRVLMGGADFIPPNQKAGGQGYAAHRYAGKKRSFREG